MCERERESGMVQCEQEDTCTREEAFECLVVEKNVKNTHMLGRNIIHVIYSSRMCHEVQLK